MAASMVEDWPTRWMGSAQPPVAATMDRQRPKPGWLAVRTSSTTSPSSMGGQHRGHRASLDRIDGHDTWRLLQVTDSGDELGGVGFGHMGGADPVVAGPVGQAHDGHAGPFPADQVGGGDVGVLADLVAQGGHGAVHGPHPEATGRPGRHRGWRWGWRRRFVSG